MPRQLTAFYPGKKFPALSVTGTRCELHCDHCRAHYLKGMRPLASPDDLKKEAVKLQKEGANGFLLSGGCDERGRINLDEFIDSISWIKENTRLKINAHTGFLDEDEASRLVEAGVDCFSLDVVQDERVIRDVLNLDSGLDAYKRTLDALFHAKAKVVPHVCVGLSNKEGEERALDLLSKYGIDSLIVLVFIPTKGTPLQNKEPPSNDRVERFVEKAVKKLACSIMLGCMRPRGNWQLEVECFKRGISGIVLPSPKTIQWVKGEGIEVLKEEGCCAIHL